MKIRHEYSFKTCLKQAVAFKVVDSCAPFAFRLLGGVFTCFGWIILIFLGMSFLPGLFSSVGGAARSFFGEAAALVMGVYRPISSLLAILCIPLQVVATFIICLDSLSDGELHIFKLIGVMMAILFICNPHYGLEPALLGASVLWSLPGIILMLSRNLILEILKMKYLYPAYSSPLPLNLYP